MQSKNYKLKGIEPGVVITRKFGKLDFAEYISDDVLADLYDSGFPYLELIEKPLKKKNNNTEENPLT
ncbi:MAG: hypothetical protein NTZ33_06220 [Bacteroidetes bacterium]|nr:hypothetical protein [Bacteroidota bacterium]